MTSTAAACCAKRVRATVPSTFRHPPPANGPPPRCFDGVVGERGEVAAASSAAPPLAHRSTVSRAVSFPYIPRADRRKDGVEVV